MDLHFNNFRKVNLNNFIAIRRNEIFFRKIYI